MDIEKLRAFLESPEGKESMVRFGEKMRIEQENEDKWKNHVLNHLNKFTDEDLAWELDLIEVSKKNPQSVSGMYV